MYVMSRMIEPVDTLLRAEEHSLSADLRRKVGGDRPTAVEWRCGCLM